MRSILSRVRHHVSFHQHRSPRIYTGFIEKDVPMLSPAQRSGVDPLQHFSWWIFAGASILFTAFGFTSILYRDGARVLTKDNARPRSAVLSVHSGFLLTLAAILWIANLLYPHLPEWMIDTYPLRGVSVSNLDVLFIVVMGVLHLIERRWIYVDAKLNSES